MFWSPISRTSSLVANVTVVTPGGVGTGLLLVACCCSVAMLVWSAAFSSTFWPLSSVSSSLAPVAVACESALASCKPTASTVMLPPAVIDRSSLASSFSSVFVIEIDGPTAASVDSTEPAAWLSLSPVWSAVIDKFPPSSVVVPEPTRASVVVSAIVMATTTETAMPAFTPALANESVSRFDLDSRVTSLASLMTALSSTSAVVR